MVHFVFNPTLSVAVLAKAITYKSLAMLYVCFLPLPKLEVYFMLISFLCFSILINYVGGSCQSMFF